MVHKAVWDFYHESGSRIPELYSVSQDLFEYFLCTRRFLLVGSFVLPPSNQYSILVKTIPICFKFAKLRFCQVSLLLKCSLIYMIYSCCLHGPRDTFLFVNVTPTYLNPLVLFSIYFNNFWISARLVCSFCEAMAGSLSVATTAVSSVNVAVAVLLW
jgi:hypothetical protein